MAYEMMIPKVDSKNALGFSLMWFEAQENSARFWNLDLEFDFFSKRLYFCDINNYLLIVILINECNQCVN